MDRDFRYLAKGAGGFLLQRRGGTRLVDIAYQGLGDGLVEDVTGLRTIIERLPTAMVAYSCNKNFGLHRERSWRTLGEGRKYERRRSRAASRAGPCSHTVVDADRPRCGDRPQYLRGPGTDMIFCNHPAWIIHILHTTRCAKNPAPQNG